MPYKGINLSPLMHKLATTVETTIGTNQWFDLAHAKKIVSKTPAYICRELVSRGVLEKKKDLVHDGKYPSKWETKYRLVKNPPLKKKKMKKQYDSDMIAMFFGANNFKSKGKQTWEKDEYRVKVIAGHKFLITNTDASKKHKHIATVLIPKDDQTMYTLFRDLIGMKLSL